MVVAAASAAALTAAAEGLWCEPTVARADVVGLMLGDPEGVGDDLD